MKTTTSCRKPEVVDVFKKLVVFMINSNCVSKEQNTLNPIMKAFEGRNMAYNWFLFLRLVTRK